MKRFDITLAFDTTSYLNPELYLLTNTIKDKLPDETIVHITTNRDNDDKVIRYMEKNLNTKIYHKEQFKHLKSRCKYMFHCFEVETDKDWLVKIEADFLVLKHLESLYNILDDKLDLVLEPENRKIFHDYIEVRLWRNIYRYLGIEMPKEKIQFRENNELGLPLFGTGLICVKSKLLDKINERWIPLIEKCERWLNYGIHPNEFAFTALVFDEKWKWKLYPDIYKFNPIGHFRKGKFPSIELIDNCKLPEETIILDYHRPKWLFHIAKFNYKVKRIIQENKDFIPEEWWNLGNQIFQEHRS